MALPADFSKIFGSTATGGLTPIGDVDYAKGWEFVGSNPPTKNDFSYLQNLSDRKSQYLYKVIGGESGAPAIGIPFFWPSSAMPNTVMPEWSDMVFLKLNDATFSAETYPKLSLVWPGLKLTDARGEFIRIWDDGRGVDSGRGILSAQGDAIRNITGSASFHGFVSSGNGATALASATGALKTSGSQQSRYLGGNPEVGGVSYGTVYLDVSEVVPTASENRPRNISFNFLVRAK